MKKWLTLVILMGTTWPAMAAKSLPIEEFEQLLNKLSGKNDARVAQELAEIELTERVSPQRLAKWEKSLPGEKTREVLLRLADMAAFENPPALDVMRIVPPDSDTQERMLSLASDYAKTTMPHLPKFSALLEITHFEDVPTQEQVLASGTTAPGWRMRPLGIPIGRSGARPLHSTGANSAAVTIRDGSLVQADAGAGNAKRSELPLGLTASSKFGPLLSVVIGDAISNQVTWGYWQRGTGDPMAVVRYSVPDDRSNYPVEVPMGAKMEEVYPAYHGEIAIDPATGSILRVSIVADLMGTYQWMQSALLMEFTPIAVGESTYICPAHAVAFFKGPAAGSTPEAQNGTAIVQTRLDDLVFSQYQPLGTEAQSGTANKSQSEGGIQGKVPEQK